jgi:hypothetical protein
LLSIPLLSVELDGRQILSGCRFVLDLYGITSQILHDKLGLKIPSSLGAACPIDQPEKQKSATSEGTSDGIDGTQSEWLSRESHRGDVVALP